MPIGNMSEIEKKSVDTTSTSANTKRKKTEKSTPIIHKRETIIDFEDLGAPDANGYTFGFYGETKTGKTITAIQLANLRIEMIPAWESHYPKLANALRNGEIPEVKEIIIIDTEDAIKKQLGQVLEKRLFKYINGHVPIKRKRVPVVIPSSTLESLQKGELVDDETAQAIYDCVDIVENAIQWVSNNSTPNTLVLFDSASVYLDLLLAKATVQYDRRVADKGDEVVKQEGIHKYQERKRWWNANMSRLRGTAGWVISTFRVIPNSERAISVAKRAGRTPKYTKTLALDTTGFNLDMEYDFTFGEESFIRNIDIRVGRWVDEDDENQNKFVINSKTRYSALGLIERMLENFDDKCEFGDDDDFSL